MLVNNQFASNHTNTKTSKPNFCFAHTIVFSASKMNRNDTPDPPKNQFENFARDEGGWGLCDWCQLLRGRAGKSVRGTNFLPMVQHSSLIHPHPHHAHLHPRPEWKLQNVSGKDAKFSAQLEDKSAKDSPFILSYHHPYYCQKSPFWALLPLFVLSYHNLLPRAFSPTSKGNFEGKFILEMARSWNIWATATVIVCLNFKPLPGFVCAGNARVSYHPCLHLKCPRIYNQWHDRA